MPKKVEDEELIKAVGFFYGASTKNNFDVELKIRFTESDLYDAIQFISGIGRHLKLLAVVDEEKVPLVIWGVNKLSIDKNAQTTISLKSTIENANMDNINKLLVEEQEIVLKAKVITE